MRTRSLALALLPALVVAPGCFRSSHKKVATSASTASFDADVAVRWLELLYDIVKSNPGASPPVAARAYGYAGVTLWESVVPGMPGYKSLGGQLNDFDGVPQPDGVVDFRAVANTALAAVIKGGAVPNISGPNSTAVDMLEADINGELAVDGDPEVLMRSADLGADIAAAILAWLASDGYTEYSNCAYTPPVGSGLWTPLAGQSALQPCWDQIRPFVLLPAGECGPGSHPPFSEVNGSDFWNEANEVYTTTGDSGANLTADQEHIAYFWADGPGGTGTPPGHWVSVVCQICEADGESLAVAAEAFCKLGIAVSDAFISCWQTKYIYNLERPITYIQRVIDATWDPEISTPPFPEYTSGHSVQSGAAAVVLTDVLGARAFDDDTHTIHNNTVGPGGTVPAMRSFTDFQSAADEAAISRLYGGIHFRAAIDNGVAQGACVANELLADLAFQE